MLPATVPNPTFTQIVECERQIMKFLNWDLMFITPGMILKLLLANGVVFDSDATNSFGSNNIIISPKLVADKCLQYLDFMVRNMLYFRDKKPSLLACAIVY